MHFGVHWLIGWHMYEAFRGSDVKNDSRIIAMRTVRRRWIIIIYTALGGDDNNSNNISWRVRMCYSRHWLTSSRDASSSYPKRLPNARRWSVTSSRILVSSACCVWCNTVLKGPWGTCDWSVRMTSLLPQLVDRVRFLLRSLNYLSV